MEVEYVVAVMMCRRGRRWWKVKVKDGSKKQRCKMVLELL